MNTEYKILMIFVIFSFGLVLYFGLTNKKRLHQEICEEFESMVKMNMNGIIVDKFKNQEHHMRKTIVYHSGDNEIVWDINEDISGIWEFVEDGDSISKDIDSPEVKVFRNKIIVESFSLNFGCE